MYVITGMDYKMHFFSKLCSRTVATSLIKIKKIAIAIKIKKLISQLY